MKEYFTPLWQELSRCAGVEAIALAGSRAGKNYDSASDYDLYVYCSVIPAASTRKHILEKYCSYMEIENQFWELEDDCTLKNGIDIDIIYRDLLQITSEISSAAEAFQARNGYTTCLWYNLMNSQILYDPKGQLAALQTRFRIPYPPQLQQNIIKKNRQLLSGNLPSYDAQIQKALQRRDPVSVNHRLAAFLESYFDIIFALNGLLHPGEKRMIAWAEEKATVLPEDFAENIHQLLQNKMSQPETTMRIIDQMVINLDKIIRQVLPD